MHGYLQLLYHARLLAYFHAVGVRAVLDLVWQREWFEEKRSWCTKMLPKILFDFFCESESCANKREESYIAENDLVNILYRRLLA